MFYVLQFDCSYDCFLARSLYNTYRMSRKNLTLDHFKEVLKEDFELDFICFECDDKFIFDFYTDNCCLVF